MMGSIGFTTQPSLMNCKLAMSQNNTCSVQADDGWISLANSANNICSVPCCSFSLNSLQSTDCISVHRISIPKTIVLPRQITLQPRSTAMQTRAGAKKGDDEDEDCSVNWDAEKIFEPPQRYSKSHELDCKISTKSSGIPASSNPLFTPLGLDDSDKQSADDTFSFKPSLSKDMEDDSSFSHYLGMSQPSLKGSPTGRSTSTQDLQLDGNMAFQSPMNDMNDKDAQIMNEVLGMSFDFNENLVQVPAVAINGTAGFNFPRLKPCKSNLSSFSVSTPPRNGMKGTPDRPKHMIPGPTLLLHANHASGTARNQGSYAYSYDTPARHSNHNRTIYHVASKSPSKNDSHSTPKRSMQDRDDDNATDKSPEFIPPRSKLRTESRNQNGPLKSSSPSQRNSSHHHEGVVPVKSNSSSESCVTPSPSQAQCRIGNVVSNESNTPPDGMMYYHPTLNPPSYDGTPSSNSYPNANEAGIPRPPSFASPTTWSNSLHLAPLPPFVASNGAPPTPQWQHPGGITSAQASPQAFGYQHYSPYYNNPKQQQYPNIQSSKESSVEATHWRQKHHLLYQFGAKFGHCRVPPGYGMGTEYEGLFEWVTDQNLQYQRMLQGEVTTMTPTRARVLMDIGCDFTQYSNEYGLAPTSNDIDYRRDPSSWSHWISLLTEYKQIHGHCDVPIKYPPNPPLGTFVNRQRAEYRKMKANKPSSMTHEKVDELERLGFTWAVRESRTSWEDRFEELKAYKTENGHANVPKAYSKNPSLGYWVNEQRFQYRRRQKNKPSCMTEDKIKALNSLDFKWSLRETNGSWDNWLKELSGYKDQHGDVDVPLKYKPNLALGAFVNRQRTEHRKLKQGLQSSLTEKRIEDLNKMGFKWSIRVSRTPWEKRLNELKEFKAQYGHTNVPSTYLPNQPLAYWVFKQRGQYRIYLKNFTCGLPEEEKPVCHMTPDRMRMLNELGFEWNPPRRMR